MAEEVNESLLGTAAEFVQDVYSSWRPRLLDYIWRPDQRTELLNKLKTAQSYDEWHRIALALDHLQGNDIWRLDPASTYYDYKLISSLVSRLGELRYEQKLDELAEVVRSGLIRNMGSIAASELYTCAYAGTKSLIETYITNVCESLVTLSQSGGKFTHGTDPPSTAESRLHLKTFFRHSRQSYGRTALILQGGSLFGLCHLGVVKSLLDTQLLPSVICGATVGSIIAAYVCSMPFDDLEEAIGRVPSEMLAFEGDTTKLQWDGDSDGDSTASTLNELEDKADSSLDTGIGTTASLDGESPPPPKPQPTSKHGLFTKEVLMFLEFVIHELGDITFEEAYIKSGRILNILIQPAHFGSSSFYNYLVTPKVIVRSAVLASIGSKILPGCPQITLYVKDYEGKIRPDPNGPQEFWPANHKTYVPTRESPYTRLAELFNVNNYVVSISRPYYASLLLTEFRYRGKPRFWLKLVSLMRMSMQYRLGQLADWGLLSPWLKNILIDEMIPGGFQVNVVPESDELIRDLMLLFDTTHISQKVMHWMDLGERSVWPQVSIIWARSKIEYVLEDINEEFE